MCVCDRCGSVIAHSEAAQAVCAGCLLSTAVDGNRADTPEDSFGNYEILCEIGEGGMGIVYLAEQHQPVHREVAVKVLKAGLDTTAVLRRFDTERQALALMQHPNIAVFHDAGTSSRGRPYFVMEFVDGLPITTACDGHACTITQRLVMFAEVCRAIEHAHSKGIVHRDIKPSNVLVAERDGRLVPKVIDFGIARAAAGHLTGRTVATTFGELLGTPEYMSPEQATFDSHAIGPASDTYSLGVLLYELLSGVLPFDPVRLRESGIAEATRIIREEEAPRTAARLKQTGLEKTVAERRGTSPKSLHRVLSRDLGRVLHVCLQKEPKARYPSVAALADDLDRYLEGAPVVAQGPTPGYRARKWLTRHRVLMGIGAGTILAGALIPLFSHRPPLHPPTPPVIRPLTSFTGTEVQPSFSPDGKQFAFVWDGGGGNFEIYIKPVDGGSPAQLTRDSGLHLFPAWSPDGRYLAFVHISPTEKLLCVIPAGGGQERKIASLQTEQLRWVDDARWFWRQPGPAWSPDGKSLVISDYREQTGPDALYEFSIDGHRLTKLTQPEPTSAGDCLPAFSPDGRLLAFVRNGSTRGHSSINLLDRGARRERRVLSEERAISGLAWMSPRQLLFSSNRSGPNTLWRLSLPAGRPSPLLGAGRGMMFISYSRATGRVAFGEESRNENIWRIPLHRGKSQSVAEKFLFSSRKTDSPEYAPNGDAIAFVSNRLGTRQIWVAKASGSDPVQLSSVGPEVPIGTPRWSPDARQIVFDTVWNGHSAIAIMSADGSNPHVFAGDPWDDMMPSWSHDGQWIYFTCRIDGAVEVCRKPVGGSTSTPIASKGGSDPRESADRRFVFYAATKGIWQVPRDGGRETPLPGLSDVDPERYWTVAGDSIYLLRSSRRPWIVYRYILATHSISPVATIEKAPNFGSPGLSVSPDLAYLLFGQIDQQGTDIVTVEGIFPE
jgi:serine/threonine protein kinase/Tol biopolymer transport system component